MNETQRMLRDFRIVSANDEVRQPSLTINEDNIFQEIDGLRALRQSMRRMLMTERYANTIYDHSYGIEFQELVGKDTGLVQVDIDRRIQETLLEDDRVKQVINFSNRVEGNILHVTFTVITIFGSTGMEVEYEI